MASGIVVPILKAEDRSILRIVGGARMASDGSRNGIVTSIDGVRGDFGLALYFSNVFGDDFFGNTQSIGDLMMGLSTLEFETQGVFEFAHIDP